MSEAKIMKTLNGYAVYDEAAHREIETLKGAAPGLVFDTVTDMEAYVAEHSAELRIGQDLYIRQADVPDYWWDGTQAIPVETDMTEIRKEMENLSEAIADHGVWYAVCNTYSGSVRIASTQSGDFELSVGARVGVLMGYDMHGSKLNVDNTGAYPIVSAHYTTIDENGETVDVVNIDIPVIWQAHGQVIWFTFDGAYWIADSSVRATEDTVGVVTISDKIDKVSSTTAASTTAVKTVNDRLTNALAAYIDDIAALVGGDA